jgi:hypothetical protein
MRARRPPVENASSSFKRLIWIRAGLNINYLPMPAIIILLAKATTGGGRVASAADEGGAQKRQREETLAKLLLVAIGGHDIDTSHGLA